MVIVMRMDGGEGGGDDNDDCDSVGVITRIRICTQIYIHTGTHSHGHITVRRKLPIIVPWSLFLAMLLNIGPSVHVTRQFFS